MSIKLTIEAESETELTRLLRALVADRVETEASSLEAPSFEAKRLAAGWRLLYEEQDAKYFATWEDAYFALEAIKRSLKYQHKTLGNFTLIPLYER